MYANPAALDADSTARRLRALSRIRKLLRLAEDQADRPEGASAKARAEALMKEHGLDRHKVTLDSRSVVDFRHRRFDLGQREPWRRALVDAIAEYFDCVALYEGTSECAETYGPEASLPQLEYTFAVYLRELVRRWKLHVKDLDGEGLWGPLTRRQKLQHREAFCTSFVMGVRERLVADRQDESEEDPHSAASNARQRRDLAAWMRRAGVRYRSKPGRAGGFSDAGYQAGKTVEVDAALRARRGPRQLHGAA